MRLALWGPFSFKVYLLNHKNNTGCSPIFRLALLFPFPFPNAPFRSQMHPFRILKVQWGGTCPPPPGVGSRSVRYRLIFVLKNNTGRSRHFRLALLVSPFRSQMHLSVPNCTNLEPSKCSGGTRPPPPCWPGEFGGAPIATYSRPIAAP